MVMKQCPICRKLHNSLHEQHAFCESCLCLMHDIIKENNLHIHNKKDFSSLVFLATIKYEQEVTRFTLNNMNKLNDFHLQSILHKGISDIDKKRNEISGIPPNFTILVERYLKGYRTMLSLFITT